MLKLKEKLGEFWWWSICLFIAFRSGDVINAIAGVWLVPKFVAAEELGAVLPLTGLASFTGLPMGIAVAVFLRYLGFYNARGESGKVKALLNGFIGASVLLIVVMFGFLYLVLPLFFERIRVANGSLGILIVLTAALGALSPVFNNALQGLSKFKMLTTINLCTAPFRFLVMLVTMPIRALSGYMLGQCAGPLLQIVLSIFTLRKMERGVKAEPHFWRNEWKGLATYAVKIGMLTAVNGVSGMMQMLTIRQRLPEVESAGYYMISRFAEIATYGGSTLALIMFPMAVDAAVKGQRGFGLIMKTMLGTLLSGAVCVAVLAVGGKYILGSVELWRQYAVYAPDMTLLSAALLAGMASTNLMSFETAANRFGFLWYAVPINLGLAVFLVSFTGFGFFAGILPDSVVSWMESLHIASLRNIIVSMLVSNLLLLISGVLMVLFRRR